jgi:hypothetical protein
MLEDCDHNLLRTSRKSMECCCCSADHNRLAGTIQSVGDGIPSPMSVSATNLPSGNTGTRSGEVLLIFC